MNRQQAGFTLIELVIVIVILGILAATALPRFIDVQSDARNASVQGVEGGIRAAAGLAHAKWLVGGSTGTNVTMDGASVAVTYGWPSGNTGIQEALGGGANGGVGGDYTFTAGTNASGTATWLLTTNCQVIYNAPDASGESPVVTVTSSGC